VKSILRRRPSPALVIALIALFVSLSGVAYGVATGSIDSREIAQNTIRSGDLRNNDVRSRDLRNNEIRTGDVRNNEVRGVDIRNSTVQGREVALNTLTGDDINESRLGKVPSATSADQATSAGDASTVGGLAVRNFFAKPSDSTRAMEVFRGDTFIIRAGCSAAGDPSLQLDGLAGGAPTNLTVQGTAEGMAAATPFHLNDPALAPGDNHSLLGAAASAAGTAVVSSTDGRVATIVYAADGANAFAGENVCAVRGTVTFG
jgi:hypothetical protein